MDATKAKVISDGVAARDEWVRKNSLLKSIMWDVWAKAASGGKVVTWSELNRYTLTNYEITGLKKLGYSIETVTEKAAQVDIDWDIQIGTNPRYHYSTHRITWDKPTNKLVAWFKRKFVPFYKEWDEEYARYKSSQAV